MTLKGFHVIATDLRQSRKFPLGQVVITRKALEAIPPDAVRRALARHAKGDWGDLCDEDRQENELSLQEGYRLLSVYRASDGTAFWIIVRRDRRSSIAA